MQELIHIRGKLLGVDFGDKRTGLAVSDEGQRMASGICQIQVGGMQKTAAETARIARERSAVGIVVGLPVNMDGSHGPRSAHAEKFARATRSTTGLRKSTVRCGGSGASLRLYWSAERWAFFSGASSLREIPRI